jgi:hypothetical protein
MHAALPPPHDAGSPKDTAGRMFGSSAGAFRASRSRAPGSKAARSAPAAGARCPLARVGFARSCRCRCGPCTVLGGGGLATWGRFAGGEICWWREPIAGLNTRFIGFGATSGGIAAPTSSRGCASSAIRRAIRRASSPAGSKSADPAPKAASHVGGGHKPNAVFARKQAVVRSSARPPRFPRTAPRYLGPLLAPAALPPRHTADTTPVTTRTQPRGPRRKIPFYAGRPAARPAAACSKV